MRIEAASPKEYLEKVPEDRKTAMSKLVEVINGNLPEGFEFGLGYGMLAWYVPHRVFPAGYHCDPKLPLPFMNLASQKNSINFYHSGIYADKGLLDWFVGEFPKHSSKRLDMGKSCIRFKKPEDIPFELIGELVSKVSVEDWISTYTLSLKK